MQRVAEDTAGPTEQRFIHARGDFTDVGTRSARRIVMCDDALGRAYRRHKLSGPEYYALKRYAAHWLAGGLQGPMQSVDLNRIYAFDPAAMSGLAKSERQKDHRDAYRDAKIAIGRRPGIVADQVACYDVSLRDTGFILGYRSPWHAAQEAREILAEAGYRLAQFWRDCDRR
jgi:hypothetical protein